MRDEEYSIFESAIRFRQVTLFGIIYAIGNTFTFKGYQYNDASVESPIENTANGFCLIIMIILFAFMGNVSSIWEILSVCKLIGIICIFSELVCLGLCSTE